MAKNQNWDRFRRTSRGARFVPSPAFKRTVPTAPPHRQYVSCSFGGGKPLTFHNDGEPMSRGDEAIVSTKSGSRIVEVVEVLASAPPYSTPPARKVPPRRNQDEADT